MLYEEIDDPESVTPADLRQRYAEHVAAAVEAVGVEQVASATDIDRGVVEALARGETSDLDLSDAAAVLALQPDAPDADAILLEERDELLMGMSMAVLDVDALAVEADGDLSPKEIQQRIEGRAPMTLAEYATLNHAIEGNKR